MELGRYIVLSTAHISCATAELLNKWARLPAAEQPIAIASTQYGWFLSTRETSDQTRGPIPDELKSIFAFGRNCDCDYVLLDCDGPEEPRLQIFPW